MRRCFQCHSIFPASDFLKSLPRGNAFAYDPFRGRLWLVCTGCRRWSLVPIEERWEILEELERRVVDSARLITQTNAISLFSAGRYQVVRVGQANRREEAWWRYGRELGVRYGQAKQIARRGEMIDTAIEIVGRAVVLLAVGFPHWPARESALEDRWLTRARERQFGAYAWRGEAHCRCGAVLHELPWTGCEHWHIDVTDAEHYGIRLPCTACGQVAGAPDLRLEATEADHLVRRALAYRNFAGASEKQIDYATTMIDQAGSAERVIRRIAEEGKSLGRLISTERFALEIATHEENERALAAMEVRELEERWKREEEIAAIVDGELTPLPGQEREQATAERKLTAKRNPTE